MSYYATFRKLTDEVMEKYNKRNKTSYYGYHGNSKDNYKLPLMVYILQESNNDNVIKSVKDAAFNIRLNLAGLQADVEQKEEQFAYDRWKEDGELWYCGWQFSKDQSDTTVEDVYDYVVERLTLLKFCVKTNDYFEENSNFGDKLQEVEELLDYFTEQISEIKIYSIMEDLKDYRVDEDDEHDRDNEEPIHEEKEPHKEKEPESDSKENDIDEGE